MYKILVADDEQIVLDSIRYIVEKNFTDVVVAGTARSGREAVEQAEAIVPDIVLMDIKMPGINGIEAVREIKSRLRNVLFVIITAYEQFDFAKEALSLGVTEFLTKPVNREKIVETIKHMVEIIRHEREKRKKELELKEKLESVLPILENGFINSILFLDDHSKELEGYRSIFEITEDYGYIMTAEFGETENPGDIGNRIGLSVKSQSYYPYFRNLIKSCCKCIVGPLMLNRIVVFIPSEPIGEEYSHRLKAVTIAEYIYNKLSVEVEADFYLGIGKLYKGFEYLSRSYEESLKAIRHAGGKGFVHISDVPVEGTAATEYPLSKEKLLLEKASIGNTSESLRAFTAIFDWLVNEYANNIQNIKNKLIELIVLIHRHAWEYKIEDGELMRNHDYINELQAVDDICGLKRWCRDRIELITLKISEVREKKVNSLILIAKEYISTNYNKEITLEDVSREVNISPHYFCKLFKEEAGENFIEYLTSVRIERAKRFLEEGRLSIKEICFEIGYGDPNYFSRNFKKVEGMTPTEYKDNIQNKMR